MPPRPESAARLNPIQTRGGLRLLCLPRLGSPWGIAVSPKVGSEDPAPTPQPIAQLRRDPPVRHAVESGAVQHEKVLFYAPEGGHRGHRRERRGLRVSLTQARRAGELSIVALRGHPPVRRPHPPPLAARTERGPSSIDRAPASSPPREPSLMARKGPGKSEDWRETRAAAPWPGDRRAEYDRSIAKGGRGGEGVDQFWARNLAPGSSGTLCCCCFLGRRTRLDDQTQQTLQGGGGGLGLNKGAIW